ncbi:MAG: TrbG/VirB9 family P-type conjugative transfer protein [Rickettsiales bacterium]|nr:TrbG/VirB9 family P-type conjugative transfer protein [Rickettsiales bacterium]
MIRLILAVTIVVLALAPFAHNIAHAQTGTPIVTDSRIKTFVYNESDVYSVLTHYGYQSNVEFGKHEEVMTVSVGDRIAWQIVPAGRRLFIKALEENAHTNMTVVTNKRAYQFDLRASGRVPLHPSEELVYVVRFFYPDEQPIMPSPPIYSDVPAPPAMPQMVQQPSPQPASYVQAAPVPAATSMPLAAPMPQAMPPQMSPMAPTPMAQAPASAMQQPLPPVAQAPAAPQPAPASYMPEPQPAPEPMMPDNQMSMMPQPQPFPPAQPMMSPLPQPMQQQGMPPMMPDPMASPYPPMSQDMAAAQLAMSQPGMFQQQPMPEFALPPVSQLPPAPAHPSFTPAPDYYAGSDMGALPPLSPLMEENIPLPMQHAQAPMPSGLPPLPMANPMPAAPMSAPMSAPPQAFASAEEAANYNYTFSGPDDLAPIKIYDDGASTYFMFQPSSRGIPQFYKIGKDGREVPVAATLSASGEMVVTGLAPRFSIRRNGANVMVFNEKVLAQQTM